MAKTVYVIIYSTWGHTKAMADKVMEGLVKEGINAKLYQVPETLPEEVLSKMYAKKFDIPVITPQELTNADGFLLGYSTRFGMVPAQMKSFWDATGGLWASRGLEGKYCGMFISTASQHGGQETSILTFLPVLAHHGINYVPTGWSSNLASEMGEIMGGGPWGAATIAAGDGSRFPSQKEQDAAVAQGVHFGKTLNRLKMSYAQLTLEEILDDLQARFILNIPQEEAHSIERIGFQIEQAHWFYEDFVREENPALPSYSLKNFSFLFFASCPTLKQFYPNREFVYSEFLKYKVRVPVCGAIIIDESLSNVLLVRGYKNDASWSWPKGKINQDESEPDCALREVLEETGFDGSAYLKPQDYIERNIKDKRVRLYILLYVPKNTQFQTRTRKEIGAIEWFPLTSVPGFGKVQDKEKKHKFYLVTAFMPRLIQFLKKEIKNSKKPVNNKIFSGYKTDYKTESESEYVHEKSSKVSIKNIESKRIALLAALKPQKSSDDDSRKLRKKKEGKKSAVVVSVSSNVTAPKLLKREKMIKTNPLLSFKFDVDRILLAMSLKN